MGDRLFFIYFILPNLIEKENTSEELEVDETITTKTSNSKLEFSRLHAAQMFESLPLMYLQIYFLNWKSNISGDQFWLVGASILY